MALPRGQLTPLDEVEKLGKIQPVPLVNGYIHLHWVRGLYQPTYSWQVKGNRIRSGMCGTPRCVKLEIKHGDMPVICDHDWRPPKWGTMICDKCGEVEEFEFVVGGISGSTNSTNSDKTL